MDMQQETIKAKDNLILILREKIEQLEKDLHHAIEHIDGLSEINLAFNKMVSDIVNKSGLKIVCCAGVDTAHGEIEGVSHTAGEIIKAAQAMQNQVLQLLEVIYNSAEGEICMGYKSDIEGIARSAYEITGINASQLKAKK